MGHRGVTGRALGDTFVIFYILNYDRRNIRNIHAFYSTANVFVVASIISQAIC
jgi:hypothetical protein